MGIGFPLRFPHTRQKLSESSSKKKRYLKIRRLGKLGVAFRASQAPAGPSRHCMAGSRSQERTGSFDDSRGSPNKGKAPIHSPKQFLPTELLSNI